MLCVTRLSNIVLYGNCSISVLYALKVMPLRHSYRVLKCSKVQYFPQSSYMSESITSKCYAVFEWYCTEERLKLMTNNIYEHMSAWWHGSGFSHDDVNTCLYSKV